MVRRILRRTTSLFWKTRANRLIGTKVCINEALWHGKYPFLACRALYVGQIPTQSMRHATTRRIMPGRRDRATRKLPHKAPDAPFPPFWMPNGFETPHIVRFMPQAYGGKGQKSVYGFGTLTCVSTLNPYTLLFLYPGKHTAPHRGILSSTHAVPGLFTRGTSSVDWRYQD